MSRKEREQMAKERIRAELERALARKKELIDELRELEKTSPTSFSAIWRTRDRVADWEGRAEGLQFALDELGG
jgi:hypothetical protein